MEKVISHSYFPILIIADSEIHGVALRKICFQASTSKEGPEGNLTSTSNELREVVSVRHEHSLNFLDRIPFF